MDYWNGRTTGLGYWNELLEWNVSFADPRGSGGVKAPTDPFAIQLGYRQAVSVSPRYAFSGQHPQAYTLTYGSPQHNPNAMV